MADGDSPRELLVRAGLRPTRRRLAVLAALGEAPAPLTAAQARERAAPRAAMDRVTAYRILEGFCAAGLAAVLAGGEGPRRYMLIQGPGRHDHPHFLCRQCREVSCLDGGLVTLDLQKMRQSFPGQISQLVICLEGICPRCLAGRKRSPA